MTAPISVEEARVAIAAALSPLPEERVPLAVAAGRTLSRALVAGRAQPPFDASAMDGYAVRLADVADAGARLRIVGEAAAGARFRSPLPPGAALRIFTGAPVPAGADHVLIQEDAERDGDDVIVRVPQSRARNIRRAGIDFVEGDMLIAAGERLSGARLALAAAANFAEIPVRRRPRVALIANGDELVLPGLAQGEDQILCSIPFALADLVAKWGGAATFIGLARDEAADIRAHIDKAAEFDLIVPIGGASVGDRDLMRGVFAEAGFATVFARVAVRPGLPTWFAARGAQHLLGLPGNPASALVTSELFLRHAIRRLLGAPEEQMVAARLAEPLAANGPRETYLRADLRISDDGVAIARALDDQDSSLLTVMARADALIRRRQGAPPSAAGDLVECVPL